MSKRHSVRSRQYFTTNIQREAQSEVKAMLECPDFNPNLCQNKVNTNGKNQLHWRRKPDTFNKTLWFCWDSVILRVFCRLICNLVQKLYFFPEDFCFCLQCLQTCDCCRCRCRWIKRSGCTQSLQAVFEVDSQAKREDKVFTTGAGDPLILQQCQVYEEEL